MTFNDPQNDPAVGMVANLPTYDVSRQHRDRLRRRCHRQLQTQATGTAPVVMADGTPFGRVIAPALGGAWCLAYLVEIIRFAVAIYGF